MASYSHYPQSHDELDMLLLSSPMLPASTANEQGALPPPLQLPPSSPHNHFQCPPPLRRRSNSTMAMLMGATDEHELRCRYPSKLCRHTRVRKASGALHRYCAYHRDKANANQKRWVDRQRNESSAATGNGSSASSPTASTSSAASPSSSLGATSPALSIARTKYRWIMAAAAKRDESSTDAAGKEDDKTSSASSSGAVTLSDDEWDALLSLLAPPATTSRSSGSRCEHRRRAASSPMLPTFVTKGAH